MTDNALPTGAPALRWAVKSSFLQYLARTPGSQISVAAGVEYTEQGEFSFAHGQQRRVGETDVVAFDGAVRFTSHGGMLDLVLAELVLRLSHAGGSLSVADIDRVETAAETEPPAGVVIAELEWADPASAEGTDEAGWVTLSARLTEAGASLFNGVYGPGEPLAPLRVWLAK